MSYADELKEYFSQPNRTKLENWSAAGTSLVAFSILFSFLLPYLLLPIFIAVQKQNRESDEATAVWPIINHFSWIVKIILFSPPCLLVLAIVIAFLLTALHNDTLLMYGFIVFFLLIPAFIFAAPEVQYVLHFLLALQRFLLYFYPETEKSLRLTKWRFNVLLLILYTLFEIKQVVSIFCCWEYTQFYSDHLKDLNYYTFLFLNLLLIIAALLYIPIMISVLKLTNLVSAAQNKPQIYIFLQILTHLLTRIIFISSACVLGSSFLLFRFGAIIDTFLSPLTIQIAYLLCNRRNVQVLLSMDVKTFFKLLFCPRRTATVRPATQIESTRY